MNTKLLLAIFGIVFAFSVYGTNQVVINNNDSGAGSLRQAIIDVGDGEEITFNLLSGSEIITLSSEIHITRSVIVDGANSAGSGTSVTLQVTIPGSSNWRVLFHDGWYDVIIEIKNLTIKGGHLTSGNGGAIYNNMTRFFMENITIEGAKAVYGGAIHNHGAQHLTNSTFIDNEASTSGGAIYIDGGDDGSFSSTITECKFENNNCAEGYGGAIYLYLGAMRVVKSTFMNNHAFSSNWKSAGGAIYSWGSDTITGSTFIGNHAYTGGAICYAEGNSILTNCSFINNESDDAGGNDNEGGGAIFLGSDYPPHPSTPFVTFNSNTLHDNFSYSNGGGVYLWQGTLKIKNSLLGGNNSWNGNEDDYFFAGGTLINEGYNIVEDATGSTFNATGDISGQQPNLFGTGKTTQTLANNGGATQTLAIESGSVAIGVGAADATITTDQRGAIRTNLPTIGAFEYNGSFTITWAGSQSAVWNLAENWDGNVVPTAVHDVIIPTTGVTNFPVISTSTNATCHNITVMSGASLTVNGDLKTE